MSQESLNSNNSLENEELTEEDLDAIAGGTGDDLLATSRSTNFDSGSQSQVVNSDSMFHSVDGAQGTTQAQQYGSYKPMNTSLSFP